MDLYDIITVESQPIPGVLKLFNQITGHEGMCPCCHCYFVHAIIGVQPTGPFR